ncbi:hypothetical protein B9Z55_020981 [Caenorhabditis nigoni]|uniref:Peptidase M13 C-terminal domain-containing protein n=2 Tax=Caenorhabditis nigoni TaxID=1611254 RepID=A0A2G5TQL8_9PELO|nr:hypothetical protein B9Z55_020981 [Caenorhabditis nigoni]
MSGISEVGKFQHPIKLIAIVLLWFFSLYTAFHVIKNFEKTSIAETSRPALFEEKTVIQMDTDSPDITQRKLHNWRDISVDPCQDFYKAVCGKYNEHTLVKGPRLKKKTMVLMNLVQEMMRKMADIGWTDFGFFGIFVHFSPEVRIAKTVPSFTDAQSIGEEFLGFAANNGIELDQEVLKKDAEDMMKLTSEILEFNDPPQGLGPLQAERISSIDIEKIIKALMNPSRDQKTWEKIRSRIVVDQISYFFNKTHNLETIIQKTSKRTLANFLALQIINVIHDDPVGTYSTFVDDCAATTVLTFPLAALRIFVRNHFDKENLQIASEMVEDIRESLLETFEESTWLQDETKKGAIKKLKMMKKVIGYPEEFEAPGALDAFFVPLNLSDSDSYFMTVIKTAKFKMQLHLDFVASLLPIKSIFGYVGANASYRPLENLLTINVAFLDDPFFDSTYPKYAKIASIGGVVGHEIGHGFDSIGRKLDENGQEFDWWTPENSEEFTDRAQCLADQYSNYDDPDFGRNLNGNWTIREIAADIIGVNVSWRTYQKVDFAKEPSIFGFEDERPDKLFFHLTALNWCRGQETNSLAAQKRQVHPTSSFRVNGVFSNMKSFGEAFNCPVGSPMNPEKKCELF